MKLNDTDVKIAFIVKESFKRYLCSLIGNLAGLTGIEMMAWCVALEETAAEIRLTSGLAKTLVSMPQSLSDISGR